ncbi:DUF4291 family protein, partial [Streptomyces sp. NPDC057654]|uniref:DUF4291 family protein n=1 Tax=Streptomyces sp. NPDC057654 TaxID=3346196 RepID=UPI003695568D
SGAHATTTQPIHTKSSSLSGADLEPPTHELGAPARVQWDPERDLRLQPLPHRSLQLGLTGEAARLYADEWTVSITDVTPLTHTIHAHVREGDLAAAQQLLPRESPYPVNEGALAHLHQ